MKFKKYISLILALVIFTAMLPARVFAEEYISLKDIADANGYEYFYYDDNESVNMRSAVYILSFQKDNVNVGYKTVVGDVGTVTLKSKVKAEGDTLYVSKTDAQTKLIRYFPNTPISGSKPAASTKAPQTPSVSQPSDWALEGIQDAIANNLVTSNTQKNYQANITREYFCELVIKLYEKICGTAEKGSSNVFKDTNNTDILKAYNLGIVYGVSDTEFAPDNFITRQEICAMLVRAIGVIFPGIDLNDYQTASFKDSGSIASWAMSSVQFAYDNNIVYGVGDNKIDPLGYTTCEQAIMLVNRVYENRNDLKDKEVVLETLKRLEFEDNSEVNSVSVSFSDGRDTSNVRIREIDSDDLIYTTTGLKGSAVSITTKEDFDTATIAFDYNPSGLDGTNPSDLTIGWYNTDLDRIELLESNVNTTEHTVSVETTHFSEYVLVDSKEWYSVWQRGQTIVRETDRNGDYAENFNVQLVVDCSTSMNSESRFENAKKCTYDFIENLVNTPKSTNDKFSVVQFSDNANVVIDSTNVNDTNLSDVYNTIMHMDLINGTNFNEGLKKCLENIDTSGDYSNIIVFLSDGGASTDMSILEELRNNDVRIAAVALGQGADRSKMQILSDNTNGTFVYAESSESLSTLYTAIRGSLIGVDDTDTDGDGIPDIIEITGMKNQYGVVIRTDPNLYDTDGDGVSDGEEMGKLIETDELTDIDRKHGITSNVYFLMVSDPVEGHRVADKVINGKEENVSEFVQQHIDFINNNTTYKAYKNNDGAAGNLQDEYTEMHLDFVNGTWDTIKNIGDFLDDAHVDIDNDYDYVLAQLVASEENYQSFESAMQESFISNINTIMSVISTSTTNGDVAYYASRALGEARRISINNLLDKNSSFAQMLNNIPASQMESVILSFGDKLSTIGDITSIIEYAGDQLTTAYEVVQYISLATSYASTQNEFKDVLMQMHANIYMGMYTFSDDWFDEDFINITQLADSIAEFVNNMEYYKADPINAVLAKIRDTQDKLSWNTIREIWKVGIEKSLPNAAVIINAVNVGVSLTDMLTNNSESAYYGRMLVRLGVFSRVLNAVMKENEFALLKNPCDENALLFDQSFRMYKNIQLYAYDNAIKYENLQMHSSKLFNRSNLEREAAIANMSAAKAKLITTLCHK